LKAMRRRYSPREYVEAVETIRREVPGAAVTSDVVVGFTGETEYCFQESFEFCQRIGFAGLHVFPYSARPGTTAAHLGPKVDASVKRVRMEKMLTLASEQAASYRSSLLGTTRPVLWETCRATANAPVWSGLTDNYVRVAAASTQSLGNRITPVVLGHQEGDVVWGRIA
ncbi:MAG: tRNA (N(6)-L-threonylcarbamoyladenosine(37)-C(2))-methylthiotransferase MtaB, partial [Dehalococcoidia bacterium]